MQEDYGASGDVVTVREVAVPNVRPTEVLVRVRAAATNPVDYKMIAGAFAFASPWLIPSPPRVPGYGPTAANTCMALHMALVANGRWRSGFRTQV